MTDIKTDPAILKLLEYAAKKKRISYDEVNDFLPEDITNSDKIEEVITLLEQNNIELEEDKDDSSLKVEESFSGDTSEIPAVDSEEADGDVEISIDGEIPEEDDDVIDEDIEDDLEDFVVTAIPVAADSSEEAVPSITSLELDEEVLEEEELEEVLPNAKKKLVVNEKESSIDDPIRLYLREIGKENLLTAEQEVELSMKMEDGENIIKNILKDSGMIIAEFYDLAHRAFSKDDPHNMGLLEPVILLNTFKNRADLIN